MSHSEKIVNDGEVKIDEVFIEKYLRNFKTNILIISGQKQLIIEIAVTRMLMNASLIGRICLKNINVRTITRRIDAPCAEKRNGNLLKATGFRVKHGMTNLRNDEFESNSGKMRLSN